MVATRAPFVDLVFVFDVIVAVLPADRSWRRHPHLDGWRAEEYQPAQRAAGTAVPPSSRWRAISFIVVAPFST